MKKLISFAALVMALVMSAAVVAEAGQQTVPPREWADEPGSAAGAMGFFGGITEGIPLPMTSEVIVAATGNNGVGNLGIDSMYTEVSFLMGEPVEFEGRIVITANGRVTDDDSGSFDIVYSMWGESLYGDVMGRTVSFAVNWHRDRFRNQVHKGFQAQAWDEFFIIDGVAFDIDASRSFWNVSVLEVHDAGVIYYTGNQTKQAVFFVDDEVDAVTVHSSGELYGFRTAWSHTETHIITDWIYNDVFGWQMAVQVRPSVSAFKTLQYDDNLPHLINFPGNFQEVHSTQSALVYNIFHLPNQFFGIDVYGTANVHTPNIFENLMWTDTSALYGHWAHREVSHLYAIGVLTRPPAMFAPEQAITRSEFFVMLVRAIGLPLHEMPTPRGRRRDIDVTVFPDVMSDRADFPYIMAAFNAGLTAGVGGGMFNPNGYVTLEEAIHTVVDAMGLLRLGINPTHMTPFSDDQDISPWARQAMYAGARIGLITPDIQGMIHPRMEITQAGAAAIINRLIDYMRTELRVDYTENIMNFAW